MVRKLIFIALLFIIPITVTAQLKQGFGIEYYLTNKFEVRNTEDKTIEWFDPGNFAFLYQLKYDYKKFEFYSLATICANKAESYQFAPSHSEFTVSVKYKLEKFNVKFEHTCFHPMLTNTHRDIRRTNVKMYGGQTKVGVYYNF